MPKGVGSVYQPLNLPKLGMLPTLNFQVVRSESGVVLALATSVMERMSRVGVAELETKLPGLQNLREELVDAFSHRCESQEEAIGAVVAKSVTGGWLVGELENRSGIAKPGFSEGHYWSGLVALWGLLAQPRSDGFEFEEVFSLEAGYYVARSGMQSLDAVIAASKEPLPPRALTTHARTVTSRRDWPDIRFDQQRGLWVCIAHDNPECPDCPNALAILIARNQGRSLR
jgi:hypothetical protein